MDQVIVFQQYVCPQCGLLLEHLRITTDNTRVSVQCHKCAVVWELEVETRPAIRRVMNSGVG